MNPEDLVGKKYVFDDDSVIEVIQVKQKEGDEGIVPYVTYHIHQGSSLPRKLVMPYSTFIGTFGHLFET